MMRVLVADCDAGSGGLIKGLLEKWQFEVVVAFDGPAAREIMRQEDAPRLAIIDGMGPGMDGFRLSRAIRRGAGGGGAVIILVMGSGDRKDVLRVMVCGADDYLVKPFDPVDLMICLRNARRILNLQSELDEARRPSTPRLYGPGEQHKHAG